MEPTRTVVSEVEGKLIVKPMQNHARAVYEPPHSQRILVDLRPQNRSAEAYVAGSISFPALYSQDAYTRHVYTRS